MFGLREIIYCGEVEVMYLKNITHIFWEGPVFRQQTVNVQTNEEGSEINHLAFGWFTFGPKTHEHEAQAIRDVLKVNFSTYT